MRIKFDGDSGSKARMAGSSFSSKIASSTILHSEKALQVFCRLLEIELMLVTHE